MKKITLLASLLLTTLTVSAQNYYTFTKSTATYTDLTGATSLTNNTIWDFDFFGPIASPFNIDIFGQTYNTINFEDDYFYLESSTNANLYSELFPAYAYIMDRNVSGIGNGVSPISYKVEGTSGNRILKMEVKNAGLEMEFDATGTTNLFLNYQIWFYEADKSIEYRYGNHNVTNVASLNDEGVSYIFLSYEDSNNVKGGFIDGTITSPTYTEVTNPTSNPTNLNALPAPNTVYRFALNPLAVKDQEKIEFSMFPNPTNDVLNLTFPEAVNKPYSVYDLMGREVLKGSLNNITQAQINVSTLQKGSYILRIAGSTQKFVKN
ncbi:T9SS type A sorting domain-containing protein [Paenimyroides aestuarii]|uniref:T9SS type A sorting domain-containing protein n=1 Tax=Paenimyroides aestuarii TaxID=2968490 RepID=A0ABY5NV60_9FLAO|nr:T9SS type A sorting domain-containing protein [Paenimyroides aestuarii]UUV22486.1 T9SS type A sorting domain-containing protein [Paenimyroides aestuarii]